MRDLDSAADLDGALPPFSQSEDEEDSQSEGFREGLPKTYRSRHDPHYVEALTAERDDRIVRRLPVARIAADVPADHTVGDLADSIAALGILQPLLVRPDGGRFQLIAGRRRLAAARRAGLVEVPCLVHAVDETQASQMAEADNLRAAAKATASVVATPAESRDALDRHTAAALAEIEDVVTSLHSCLPLLERPSAGMREQMALKLLAAEAERAAWAIRARHYLAGMIPFTRTPIGSAALLEHVERLARAGVALRGGTLQVEPVRGALMLHGDRALLTTAIVGLVQVLLVRGESVQDPRVVVRCGGTPGGGCLLTLTQPSSVMAEAEMEQLFDAASKGTGDPVAALALTLARHAAALHRARFEVSAGAGAGTTLGLAFDA